MPDRKVRANRRAIRRIHCDLDRVKDRIEDLIENDISWHSDESDIDVFHVCDNCDRSEQIDNDNRTKGHEGKQLCSRCLVLIYEEECEEEDDD